MTDQSNNPPVIPAAAANPSDRRPRLLTREQVLSVLREEVAAAGTSAGGQGGLTATAKKYNLSVQQMSDVLAGRSGLSKRVVERLQYKLHSFYERTGDV